MEHILEVRDVTVDFSGFKALKNLSLSIGHGELRFLIGPNGAGKTTLIDVISGKVRPVSGSVVFKGAYELTRLQEHRIVRIGIGRKFQTPALFPGLSVRSHLELACGVKSGILGYLRRRSAKVRDRADALLERLRLKEYAEMPAGSLSHGQKQWLEIGMVLIQDPALILLDEPVAGMTSGERLATGELLQEIARDRSVLIVEHDMNFVRRFSTKVSVLHQGEVIKEGTMEEVQRDPKVIDSYLGRSYRPGPVLSGSGKSRVRAVGSVSQWERADS